MFGFFKKYDAHLCSAVSGQILINGKPLAGVKIKRELYYIDDKRRVDNAITDENGCFMMPEINVRSKAPGWLFAEQRTQQHISAHFSGKNYVLWSTSLKKIEPIPAYNKKLSQLNADLLSSEIAFTFKNEDCPNVPYSAYSICRWESDCEIQHIVEN